MANVPDVANGARATTTGVRSRTSRLAGIGGDRTSEPEVGRADTSQRDLVGVARGGAVALVGGVVSSVGGFLLTIVVTRGLHATEAGIFFEAVALFTILSTVATFGADTGLLRAGSRYRALGRSLEIRPTFALALVPVIVASVALAVAVYIAAPALAGVLLSPSQKAEGVRYIHILAPFLAVSTAGAVAIQGTRGLGGVLPFVLVQNVGVPVARPVLAAAAILLGLGPAAVALAWASPVAAALVVALLTAHLQLRRLERALPREGLARRRAYELAGEFWRYAGGRGFAATLDIAILWLDVLLVGALRSTREAGIYAAASRLITTGTLVMQAARLAIAPRISALLAREEWARAEELYQAATGWIVTFSWPLYLSMGVFSPFVLAVFGPEFVQGATALSILCGAMLVSLGTGNVQTVLLMAGKNSWLIANKTMSLTCNVGLNLLLIPRYGMSGAACAWAISIVLSNSVSAFQVQILLGLRGFDLGFVIAAVSSVVCFLGIGLVARLAVGLNVLSFAVFLAIATVVYCLTMWRFRQRLRLTLLGQAIGVGRAGQHAHPADLAVGGHL